MKVTIHEGEISLHLSDEEFQTYVYWLSLQKQKVTLCTGDPDDPELILLRMGLNDFFSFVVWRSQKPEESNNLVNISSQEQIDQDPA